MKNTTIGILCLGLAVAGCTPEQDTDVNQPADVAVTEEVSSTPKIVTSFYPLAYMAQRIGGDQVEVTNIADGVDVHEYLLSPQDRVLMEEADLVAYLGAGLEPWAEEVIPLLQESGVATVEVTEDMELVERDDHDDYEEEKDEHTDENHHDEDEHTHEEEKNHDHGHHHHHEGGDPHVWLSPLLAQEVVEVLRDAMVSVAPSQAALYTQNAEALIDELEALDVTATQQFAACTRDEVIVSHDAYGYLADRYGFETHAIAGLSTQDEPSAQVLAELKEEAEEGITHILIEDNSVRAFADTLVAETGLKTLTIDPLGVGSLDQPEDFLAVMQKNINNFAAALGCDEA